MYTLSLQQSLNLGSAAHLSAITDLLRIEDQLYVLSRAQGRVWIGHWTIAPSGQWQMLSELQGPREYSPDSLGFLPTTGITPFSGASYQQKGGGRLLLLGNDPSQFASVSLRDSGDLWRRETLQGGQSWQDAIRIETPDGARIWALSRSGTDWPQPLDDKGQVLAGSAPPANATPPQSRAQWITGGQVDGQDWLVTLGADGHLRSFRVDAKGAPIAVFELPASAGLGISQPSMLQQITIGGQSFIIVAATGSSSLTVLHLDAQGQLIPRSHLVDSQHSRFGKVSEIGFVQLGPTQLANGLPSEEGERVLFLAAGADGGISLFEMLPTGRLLHLSAMMLPEGTSLSGSLNGMQMTTRLGADKQLTLEITLASDVPGIAILQTSLGLLAPPRHQETGQLLGGQAGDLLSAGAGDVVLRGEGGSDILIAGTGAVTMTGGTGQDLFVLSPEARSTLITDFTPGEDRLDLSAFITLRDIAQIQHLSITGGIELIWGAQKITILNSNARALSLADLGPDPLGGPSNYLPPSQSPPQPEPPKPVGLTLRGTLAAERLFGQAGDDTIYGGGGADELYGGAGDDFIYAGQGRATLYGGEGDDVLYIAIGAPAIAYGGAGHDSLFGANAGDTLEGGEGNDLLSAGQPEMLSWLEAYLRGEI